MLCVRHFLKTTNSTSTLLCGVVPHNRPGGDPTRFWGVFRTCLLAEAWSVTDTFPKNVLNIYVTRNRSRVLSRSYSKLQHGRQVLQRKFLHFMFVTRNS